MSGHRVAASPDEWTVGFERECEELVVRVCTVEGAARDQAWRELVSRIGPCLETWARASFVMRRCRLDNDDDARAVMVNALVRLRADEFANLRRYLERRAPGSERDRVETDVLKLAARLADPADEVAPAADRDAGTPLRAWLLTLVSYAVKDHVRQRFGWSGAPPEDGGRAASKRDLGTDAQPLEAAIEPGQRPPITDYLTLRAFLDEVMAFVASFPDDMRTVVTLWLEDASAAEIAARLGGDDHRRTRALLRAAKARLRERFRDDWHRLGGVAA